MPLPASSALLLSSYNNAMLAHVTWSVVDLLVWNMASFVDIRPNRALDTCLVDIRRFKHLFEGIFVGLRQSKTDDIMCLGAVYKFACLLQ